MPKKIKKQEESTYQECFCPYCLTKMDNTNFCAYWDCRDFINKENTPDAGCLRDE